MDRLDLHLDHHHVDLMDLHHLGLMDLHLGVLMDRQKI
jgi:hypothetical protein